MVVAEDIENRLNRVQRRRLSTGCHGFASRPQVCPRPAAAKIQRHALRGRSAQFARNGDTGKRAISAIFVTAQRSAIANDRVLGAVEQLDCSERQLRARLSQRGGAFADPGVLDVHDRVSRDMPVEYR